MLPSPQERPHAMTDLPKLLVTRRLPDAVERHLAETWDTTLSANDQPLDRAALVAAMTRYDAWMPTITDRIDADLLATPGRRVRILANYGAGVDHIDLAARGHHHEQDRDFRRRLGQHIRRVGHHHTRRPRRRQVDMVDPRTIIGEDAHPPPRRGQQVRVDPVGDGRHPRVIAGHRRDKCGTIERLVVGAQ
ncbi:hypothetical protein NS258_18365, partial [Sphingomonas sanguinis]